jgi:hypothetical protein
MEKMVDLVMKDQRQAGDAKHQHEDGANDAGTFVHPSPSPQ